MLWTLSRKGRTAALERRLGAAQSMPASRRLLTTLALLVGLVGWALLALIVWWAERGNGEALISTRSVLGLWEASLDAVSILVAFLLITAALAREVATRSRS